MGGLSVVGGAHPYGAWWAMPTLRCYGALLCGALVGDAHLTMGWLLLHPHFQIPSQLMEIFLGVQGAGNRP